MPDRKQPSEATCSSVYPPSASGPYSDESGWSGPLRCVLSSRHESDLHLNSGIGWASVPAECCCPQTHSHQYLRREDAGQVWWECYWCSDQQDADPSPQSGPEQQALERAMVERMVEGQRVEAVRTRRNRRRDHL